MSLGFQRAGFQLVHAIDSWAPAIDTYRTNLGSHVVGGMVDGQTRLPACDVIVGGPPCQGFSSAGARLGGDARNDLVAIYANLVAEHRPAAFVFENVEGFITNSEGRFLFHLLDPLIEAGYSIHVRKVNAANFGVPQHRKRVVAIGGLGWHPVFPEPTHSAWGAPGAVQKRHLPNTPTLADALQGLPRPTANGGDDSLDHVAPLMNETDTARAKLLAPGQCMRDLPEHLWHDSYRRRANRRVMDGMPTEKRGGAPGGVRRLQADAPSKAITGGAQSEFLHPSEHRPLTVRECARIQTFPDNFIIMGSRSERVQLIGNAVPPQLAFVIASTIRASFPQTHGASGTGALLTFSPTPSSGMSPVLARVCAQVARRYGRTEEGLFDHATVPA
jgi:DNA (cytosine-5)-methyltransferase 1